MLKLINGFQIIFKGSFYGFSLQIAAYGSTSTIYSAFSFWNGPIFFTHAFVYSVMVMASINYQTDIYCISTDYHSWAMQIFKMPSTLKRLEMTWAMHLDISALNVWVKLYLYWPFLVWWFVLICSSACLCSESLPNATSDSYLNSSSGLF